MSESIVEQYLRRMTEIPFEAGDPRTRDLPMMDRTLMFWVGVAYVVSVLVLKAWFKSKDKLELYWVRVIHNGAMSALSTYMFVEILRTSLPLGIFSPIVRDPNNETATALSKVLWLFYFSKMFEFTDTYIMIFRKNYHQISFLHVYHHITVHYIWWLNVYIYPGGEAAPAALANSFVHMWMYGYYCLATLEIRPWWKKYLTQLQLFQFCFMITEGFILTVMAPEEEFRVLGTLNGGYALTLLFLFMNFYRKTYSKDKKKGGKDAGKKGE